ncbi:MAG: hypothetical protein IPL39_03000 [Opitutaceae bacterium]|nr:hypothetical protein [Opitutaceae bacterium]
MVWDAVRKSVSDRWGHGPMTAEPVPATITSLAPPGRRSRPRSRRFAGTTVETKVVGGALVFTARAADKTIHYEITKE